MSGKWSADDRAASPPVLVEVRCGHCQQEVAVRVWSTHAGTSEATWICPACRLGNRLPVLGRARVAAAGPASPTSVSS
jgi:hypothetical protein